jgi:hypothetical protein
MVTSASLLAFIAPKPCHMRQNDPSPLQVFEPGGKRRLKVQKSRKLSGELTRHSGRIKRMARKLIHALGVAGLLCTAPLRAAPPPGADPDLAPWFKSLRQPQTNLSCCDRADCRADCRMVRSRIVDGHLQAFIGEEFARWQNPPHAWVDVPETSILHRHDNPTGEGVACWAGARIICFVEGTGA